MPKIEISGRVAACASVLALASAGLTACGGSSGSASNNGSSARSGASSTATSAGRSSASSGNASSAKARSLATERLRSKTATGGAPTHTPQQAAFRRALGSFASCLRQQGVHIPQPNTSGNGPVLSTKGIDTSTPQYRAAVLKCRSVLIAAFRQVARARGAGRR